MRAFPPTVVLILVALASALHAAPGYLRYPDIHDDRIVFQAESDLWTVAADGGTARRLTTHEANEYYPHFSPDGTRIAFSAYYDGNTDVYVMSAEGGEPRRLTWHPMWEDVVGLEPGRQRGAVPQLSRAAALRPRPVRGTRHRR
jgi:tricorn protease